MKISKTSRLLILVALAGCQAPGTESAATTWIAHRGNSWYAPENTLASVRGALALEPRPPFVEIDVHRSADGALVVIHDATLERTTDGSGKVAEQTWDDLRAVSAGYAERFEGFEAERLPLLADVLDAVAGTDTGVMIEIKAHGIGGDVARLLEERDEVDRHLVASFYAAEVVDALLQNPRVRTLYLVEDASPAEIEVARRIGVDVLGANHESVTPTRAALARERGLALWVYTVNEPEDVERVRKARVDGIISDRVGDLRDPAR